MTYEEAKAALTKANKHLIRALKKYGACSNEFDKARIEAAQAKEQFIAVSKGETK